MKSQENQVLPNLLLIPHLLNVRGPIQRGLCLIKFYYTCYKNTNVNIISLVQLCGLAQACLVTAVMAVTATLSIQIEKQNNCLSTCSLLHTHSCIVSYTFFCCPGTNYNLIPPSSREFAQETAYASWPACTTQAGARPRRRPRPPPCPPSPCTPALCRRPRTRPASTASTRGTAGGAH